MIMKKWFISLLLASLLALSLAACGGTEPAPAPTTAPVATTAPAEEAPAEQTPAETTVTLRIWADENRLPVLESLKATVAETIGVELILEQVALGDMAEQVRVAIPAGEGPDIFIAPHDQIGSYIDGGLIAPIDLGAKAGSFVESSLTAFTYNSELYGMPYATENVAFFRNADLVPEPVETFDDMIAVCEDLLAEGTIEYCTIFPNTNYHIYAVHTAFGGYIFNQDADGNYLPGQVGLDTPGFIASGEFIQELVESGMIPSTADGQTAAALFNEGQIPFVIDGPWALNGFREAGVNFVVDPIPAGSAGPGAPFSGVQGFVVNALSDQQLLAETFLTEFVATDEIMQAFQDQDPRIPAWTNTLENVDDEDLAGFGVISPYASPMPNIPQMGAVWGSWGDAIQVIMNGEQSAEDALTNAATQIRESIGFADEMDMTEPEASAPMEIVATLRIWADENRLPVLESLKATVAETIGVELILEQVALGDMAEQVRVAIPAGEGPDIFIAPHDQIGSYIDGGLIAPIDLGAKMGSFVESSLTAFTYNSELYGMPYATENVAFFRNADLVPEPVETFDDMIAVCEDLLAEGTIEYCTIFPNTNYHIYALHTAFGGYIFNQDADGNYLPGEVGLDTEGFIASGEFIQGLVDAGMIPSTADGQTAAALFNEGKIPFVIDGPWALNGFREGGINFVVDPIPAGSAGPGAPFSGVQGFVVNALSDQQLLAETFLTEFVATDEIMQAFQEQDPRIPAWLNTLENVDDEDLAGFGVLSPYASPMPNIPQMGAVWGSWGDAVQIIMNGEQSAEEALTNAAAQIREAIGE